VGDHGLAASAARPGELAERGPGPRPDDTGGGAMLAPATFHAQLRVPRPGESSASAGSGDDPTARPQRRAVCCGTVAAKIACRNGAPTGSDASAKTGTGRPPTYETET